MQRIFLSFTIGEVEFDYRGDVIRLFSDLTDDERELVEAKIQSYVQHGEKV
ncbi:hypothetical protein [Pustulibacterium marinum]|uniref:hypothetical protein n=1 Tax=Pustulibacterium marinum TaxID=1224947 RepID=UPI0015A67076|nr:hypothetical protein [Pustulibacterium marinum]